MDERVKKALAQWPNVPDVHGWLALDRHGQWRLRGETISNPKLIAFINRNYARQENGAYAFQNGPQKVFVELALTPYIARLDDAGHWSLHTDEPLDAVSAVFLTAQGQLVIETVRGAAALDDRDLQAALAHFCGADGGQLSDRELEQALQTASGGPVWLQLPTGAIPVQHLPPSMALTEHFSFVDRPASA